MLRAQFAAPTLIATILIVSACGSSSKSVTTTSSTPGSIQTGSTTTTASQPIAVATGRPLTRVQWISKGDAICALLNDQLAANTVNKNKSFASVLPQAAAEEQAEAAQLARLVPPAAEATNWRRFLTETREWAANTERLGEKAAVTQFTVTDPLVTQTTKIHASLMSIARREGFKHCSVLAS